MAKYQATLGNTTVEFDHEPTSQDLAEVESQINNTTKSDSTQQAEKPGFVQGLAQDVAKPFLSAITNVSGLGASALGYIAGGKDLYSRVRQTALEQGADYGYFGKVKPIGAEAILARDRGEISTGEMVKREALDFAGTMGEIASYSFAPLKGIKGTGFLKTMAKSAPFATAFGISKGLQAGAEGKSTTESITEGAVSGLSASLGYALLGKASSFVSNMGARALQSEAFRAAGKGLVDLTEKTWNALPQAFQDSVSKWTDNLINTSFRRSYQALRTEFNSKFNQAVNGAIESVVPLVDNPELTTAQFQRNLANKIGQKFQESSALYDQVKTDRTVIQNLPLSISKAESLINKMPETIGLTFDLSPKNKNPIPMTMGDIISKWQEAMTLLPKANPEQKVAIRDFASALYSDARGFLEKENPKLLNQWDSAYQSWKKATDIYESGILSELKSVGDFDTFIDKFFSKELSVPEREVFLESIKGNEKTVQDMFINSLLRKVKTMPDRAEGAKTIRDFLDNWDIMSPDGEVRNAFLAEDQANTLNQLADFLDTKFDNFVDGMRNSIGLKPDNVSWFTQQQQKLNVAELVDKGDINSIFDNLMSIKDSGEFRQAINLLNPEERRAVGITMFKDIFNENKPLFDVNPDGTLDMSSFVKDLSKTLTQLNKVGGKDKEGLLNMLYSPEQVKTFTKEIPNAIKTFENVSSVPKFKITRLFNLVLSGIYAKVGFPAASIHNLSEAIKAPSYKNYVNAVNELIEKNYLKKNLGMKIGDLMQILQLPTGVTSGQIPNTLLE